MHFITRHVLTLIISCFAVPPDLNCKVSSITDQKSETKKVCNCIHNLILNFGCIAKLLSSLTQDAQSTLTSLIGESTSLAENDIGGLRASDVDIIEAAKNRAIERQLMKQNSRSSIKDQSELTDFENNLIKKYTEKSEDSFRKESPAEFVLPRLTTDDSTEAKKELLGRRMTERAPETQSIRPPWFTEEKQNSTHLVVNSKTNSANDNKRSLLRSCNQIDFPSYTAEEMRVSKSYESYTRLI